MQSPVEEPLLSHNNLVLDRQTCDRARRAHDARFDGRFFIAITTTKIYCRPICPSPFAKYEHVRYFSTAAGAEAEGYRPCLRCRPEASPGTPAWSGTSGLVSRALRLINEGALDSDDVESFAARHGVTGRHLRRLFFEHLGSTPHQIAATRRLHFAKKLLDETNLPMHEVAYASGYGSLRSFNDKVRQTYGRSPSELRRTSRQNAFADPDCYRFRLAYRPPFNWTSLLALLELYAVPGVELVRDGQYRRTIECGNDVGVVNISHEEGNAEIIADVFFPQSRALLFIVERIRRMLDLAADPAVLAEHLGSDPVLGSYFNEYAGVRIPGAWDGCEAAILAILGQRESPHQAAQLAARLVKSYGREVRDPGGLNGLFPTAKELAAANLEETGISTQAACAIRSLTTEVSNGTIVLNSGLDVPATVKQLLAIPGIDRLTAEHISMRALGEPDAFPLDYPSTGESGPERWRPWRAYAAVLLMASGRNTF